MKIGVISDIHDNKYNLRRILQELKLKNIEKLIFLGDSNSPFIIKEICETLEVPLYFVWGNNDGDRVTITQLIQSYNQESIVSSECFLSVEIDGRNLFLTHYPEIATIAYQSGKFEAVMYGHDHTMYMNKEDETLLLNPGEIYASNALASYAVYDTQTNLAEIFEIQDSKRPF